MSTGNVVNLSESKTEEYLAVSIAMLAAASIVSALRFWAVFISNQRRFGWDDFFALLTWILVIVHTSIMIWWLSIGYGKHVQTLTAPGQLSSNYLGLFLIFLFYPLVVTTPRLSALFFFRRIFGKTQRWFVRSIWALVAINAAWCIVSVCVALFQCQPVHAAWDFEAFLTAHCVDGYRYVLINGGIGTLIDLAILVIPMPMLWGIQISTEKKWLLIGLFISGYSVVIVSVGRLITAGVSSRSAFLDFTYDTLPFYIWAQCEGPVSAISISLFHIYGLIKRVKLHGRRGWLKDSKARSDPSNSYATSEPKKLKKIGNDSVSQGDNVILVSREIEVSSQCEIPQNMELHQLGNPKSSTGQQLNDW